MSDRIKEVCILDILILSQEEKESTRFLYEQCFPEDSSAFVDYYYKEKCRDNVIMGGYEDGVLQTMLHLNPYRVRMYGDLLSVHYIVAVATAGQARGQGKMRMLMRQGMQYLYEQQEAFTFLMPANPAYYTSLGFRFWENQQIIIHEMTDFTVEQERVYPLIPKEAEHAACFANAFLKSRYDLYVERDAAYYRRLILQQNSEKGKVMVIKKQTSGDISGVFCYSNEENMEIREPMSDEGCREIKKSFLMGRIIHPEQFAVHLKSDEPVQKEFFLRDPVIWQNNGRFQLYIDRRGGSLRRLEMQPDTGRLQVYDISELGQRLFGNMRIFINEEV